MGTFPFQNNFLKASLSCILGHLLIVKFNLNKIYYSMLSKKFSRKQCACVGGGMDYRMQYCDARRSSAPAPGAEPFVFRSRGSAQLPLYTHSQPSQVPCSCKPQTYINYMFLCRRGSTKWLFGKRTTSSSRRCTT